MQEYKEVHYQNVEDIGVAWDGSRVWVCLNGQALLRAKWINGDLQVIFTKPEENEQDR